MNIHLQIVFGILLLSILFLQKSFCTIASVHKNIGRLFSKEIEPGSLELSFILYMVLAPIFFNTLLICSLGKYTLETRRSMTRCYVYSSLLAIAAVLLGYLECSIYANTCEESLIFFTAVETSTLFLTHLFFTGLLFRSEIAELKRINKVKRLGMCLVHPNIRIFIAAGGYLLWYTGIVVYLWYRVWLLGVGVVKTALASSSFSLTSAALMNYLYNVKTRL
eukprot:jgi/Antlo1/2439/423